MQTKAESKQSNLDLRHLSGYATYLLTHKLGEVALLQWQFAQEEHLPLLGQLAHLPPEQQKALLRSHVAELLQHLSDNTASEWTRHNLAQWLSNGFPFERHQVAAEDIVKTGYIRKKSLLHFLPEYCVESTQALQIVGEIDRFLLQHQTAVMEAFTRLLQQQLEERSLYIEKINTTLPGALYIFNVRTFRNEHANENFAAVMGYTREELNALGADAIARLVHPDDQGQVRRSIEALAQASDGAIHCYQYRLCGKDGQYRWFRNYESVFRRDADGTVQELIAICLNIDNEMTTSAQLLQREEQLLEAQAIARIGSYTWVLDGGSSIGTPELVKILEVPINDNDGFRARVHPEDLARVDRDIARSLETGTFETEYRYQGSDRLKHLWSRGVVHYRDGKPFSITGTVHDVTDRMALLHQVQENERLYRQAEVLANMGNWCWEPATGRLSWTDNLYTIYGLAPQSEPVSMERFLSFVHPEDRPYIEASIQRGFKGDTEDYIFRIVTADGRTRTLHSMAQAVRDEQGVLVRVFGAELDVTERHQTEQALKENQNFLRKITDATPSIITSYHINSGRYTFVSEGMHKLLGYTSQEVLEGGVPFIVERIHPDDLPALMARNNEVLAEVNAAPQVSDPIVEFRYRVRHREGSWRWLHTFGTVFDRNAAGHVEHVLNISLDVTEQMEALHKIEEQEYFIQQIADASPTVLYLFDVPSGKFEYLNREIFYVLGYTPEEILDLDTEGLRGLYHPDDWLLLPEREGSDSRFQYQESMMQYECRLRKKSGGWYWLLAREVVFRKDDDGNVQQILGAALDINHRKEMERKLLQNSFQLEQSNASLEEFAYVASHDLKEPLRKIATFGDRLVASQMERMSPDGQVYLRKVVDAAQRMQTMIDDLLSVSRISGNQGFEEHSLEALLADAVQTLEFKIEQMGGTIDAEPLPKAHVVPSQLRQLFQNLLSNSLKFVREGVPPVIRIRHRELLPADVDDPQLRKASGYLELTFTDNGIGFENEYAQRIFQIFQRLNGRSEYEGNGIGLAIVRKIVEHHGGTIQAQGVPDQGATFTIILPR
ncbi:PAS domain-containing sensor histidine kinase [Flaviaesturariibacter amylovorans]|uniref:PAS domain-containing sensor histidine kinase n=1 Tax=Flaviaesturariibacter amylovorans TaxID=1084520 RepID=UPI0031E8BB27